MGSLMNSLPMFRRSLAKSFSTSAVEAPLLVTPAQLNKSLQDRDSNVTVIDSTWFMPGSPARKAYNEFLNRRIPGAQFLDLDEVASHHELGLKHMMPEDRVFAAACEKLGISHSSHVVIYDTHGVFSSPRALFMFRSFGHLNSSVLNGGLPRWQAESLAVETDTPREPSKTEYPPPLLESNVIRNYEQMVQNSAQDPSNSAEAELVLDARSAGRFTGSQPEPRPGLSSGHIPNSFSLPFNMFLESVQGSEGTTYTIFRKPSAVRDELEKAVGSRHAERIIKGEATAVTTCGSGMTAGVLWLGLKLLGATKIGLYDESWTGYAMRPSSKIEKA